MQLKNSALVLIIDYTFCILQVSQQNAGYPSEFGAHVNHIGKPARGPHIVSLRDGDDTLFLNDTTWRWRVIMSA